MCDILVILQLCFNHLVPIGKHISIRIEHVKSVSICDLKDIMLDGFYEDQIYTLAFADLLCFRW